MLNPFRRVETPGAIRIRRSFPAMLIRPRTVKKLERAEDKERMMVRFDEKDPSGASVSVRDRDGESAASAAE
jgi:hypothetical protein